MPHISSVAVGAFVALAADGARATVVVTSEFTDCVITSSGAKIDIPVGRLGASKTKPGPGSRTDVFVFKLPSVPLGKSNPVAQASFEFTIIEDLADGDYNVDLYGLPARSTPDVVSGDNYVGSLTTTGSAVPIQDNILLSSNTLTGPVATSAVANSALAEFLNRQYGPDGSGAGKYVFLRLTPDVVPPANAETGMDISFSENEEGVPTLTIDFVPEPGVAVAPMVALALLQRHRRGRRSKRG